MMDQQGIGELGAFVLGHFPNGRASSGDSRFFALHAALPSYTARLLGVSVPLHTITTTTTPTTTPTTTTPTIMDGNWMWTSGQALLLQHLDPAHSLLVRVLIQSTVEQMDYRLPLDDATTPTVSVLPAHITSALARADLDRVPAVIRERLVSTPSGISTNGVDGGIAYQLRLNMLEYFLFCLISYPLWATTTTTSTMDASPNKRLSNLKAFAILQQHQQHSSHWQTTQPRGTSPHYWSLIQSYLNYFCPSCTMVQQSTHHNHTKAGHLAAMSLVPVTQPTLYTAQVMNDPHGQVGIGSFFVRMLAAIWLDESHFDPTLSPSSLSLGASWHADAAFIPSSLPSQADWERAEMGVQLMNVLVQHMGSLGLATLSLIILMDQNAVRDLTALDVVLGLFYLEVKQGLFKGLKCCFNSGTNTSSGGVMASIGTGSPSPSPASSRTDKAIRIWKTYMDMMHEALTDLRDMSPSVVPDVNVAKMMVVDNLGWVTFGLEGYLNWLGQAGGKVGVDPAELMASLSGLDSAMNGGGGGADASTGVGEKEGVDVPVFFARSHASREKQRTHSLSNSGSLLHLQPHALGLGLGNGLNHLTASHQHQKWDHDSVMTMRADELSFLRFILHDFLLGDLVSGPSASPPPTPPSSSSSFPAQKSVMMGTGKPCHVLEWVQACEYVLVMSSSAAGVSNGLDQQFQQQQQQQQLNSSMGLNASFSMTMSSPLFGPQSAGLPGTGGLMSATGFGQGDGFSVDSTLVAEVQAKYQNALKTHFVTCFGADYVQQQGVTYQPVLLGRVVHGYHSMGGAGAGTGGLTASVQYMTASNVVLGDVVKIVKKLAMVVATQDIWMQVRARQLGAAAAASDQQQTVERQHKVSLTNVAIRMLTGLWKWALSTVWSSSGVQREVHTVSEVEDEHRELRKIFDLIVEVFGIDRDLIHQLEQRARIQIQESYEALHGGLDEQSISPDGAGHVTSRRRSGRRWNPEMKQGHLTQRGRDQIRKGLRKCTNLDVASKQMDPADTKRIRSNEVAVLVPLMVWLGQGMNRGMAKLLCKISVDGGGGEATLISGWLKSVRFERYMRELAVLNNILFLMVVWVVVYILFWLF